MAVQRIKKQRSAAMNEWQFLDFHFEKASELSSAAQLKYIEDLSVPSDLNSDEVKKELKDLLWGDRASEGEDSFLSPATTIKSIMGPLKTQAIEKFDVIGNYIILEELGKGAFGRVYLAEDKNLGRKVALKVSQNVAGEAKTLANLEYENILKVFEELVLPDKNLRIISLQYISGPTLKDVLRDFGKNRTVKLDEIIEGSSVKLRPFSSWEKKSFEKIKEQSFIENMLDVVIKMAHALDHAHSQGILHLDIKPGNILLSPAGVPYLADFNISSSPDQQMLGGTERYMSPEQGKALEQNSRELYSELNETSDVYSLGKVLREIYDLIPTEEGILKDDLEAIITKATDPEKEDRFLNMANFAKAIEHHLCLRQRTTQFGQKNFDVKKSILLLVFMASFPHVFGSAISIAYNYLRIVALLTVEQQAIFYKVVAFYNLLVIPAGMSYLYFRLRPIFKTLYQLGSERSAFFKKDVSACRKKLVEKIHIDVFAVGSLGWLSAVVVFPLCIYVFSGELNNTAIFHFAVSFMLSWAVSVAYSIFFFQTTTLLNILPQFFGGVLKKSGMSTSEVDKNKKVVDFYHMVTAIIPMVMALFILTLDPINFSSEKFILYRAMSAVLIIIGMSGFLTVSRVRERTLRFFRLFHDS